MFELFRAIERLYRKGVIHMQRKFSITPIIDLLKALGRIWLAFMTEEHCRFCQRYIDQLGWIEKFYAKFDARNETLQLIEHQESTEETSSQTSGASIALCCSVVACVPVTTSSLIELDCKLWSAMPAKFAIPLPWEKILVSDALCSDCAAALPIVQPLVDHFYVAVEDSDNDMISKELIVASGIKYSDSMKRLIRRFKYDNDELLAKDLGAIMINGWSELANMVEKHDAIIVPVPLHWKRRHQRGYNQSALLAQEAAKFLKLPVIERALKRCKSTVPQNKLSREEREKNLADAFCGNRKLLDQKIVLLIDDVCTSGATLVECAKAAYSAGAKAVFGMTVARAVLANRKSTGQH